MKFTKSVHLAFSSILANKMRSFLTMLGIIIGVSAVIILVSIMNGVTSQVTDMFDSLGTNTIQTMIMDRGGTRAVSTKTMYKFVEEHDDLFSGVSPLLNMANTKVRAKESTDSISTTVYGVSEEYKDIVVTPVTKGRFLQYFDIEKQQNVCVVGTYVEKELFEGQSALSQTIKIMGVPYTVIGVLEEKAESAAGSNDDVVYIPYTNACKLMGSAYVNMYALTAKNPEKIDEATAALKRELTKILGSDDFFTVISLKEMLNQMNSIMGMLSTALVAIAGISLLVGGIGIMNIMLVSVTERTREIGIRKSLGAKNKNILQQFVIEAGAVSGVGGIFGIIFGILVSLLAGKLMNMKVVPSFGSICVAFGVSVAIGIIFGYLPAKKAAELNPIDALRYE